MIFSNNEINNWYKSKIGKITLNKIINYLSNSIRVDYNQKIIVHGCDNFLKSLKNILTSKNIFFIHNNNRYDLSSSIYKLPFEDNSIDTVILFHSIDFCKNPHNVFREVDRILKDDGEIILISFNIYSLLLVFKFLAIKSFFWKKRIIGYTRIKDWLNLLSYKMVKLDFLIKIPPFDIKNKKVINFVLRLENVLSRFNFLGCINIFHAKKENLRYIDMKIWKKSGNIIKGRFAKPIANKSYE